MPTLGIGNNTLAQGGANGTDGVASVNATKITTLSELQAGVSNKTWSIQGIIDLGGATLNIPSGVILKFDGGSLSNGTLNGDKTYIWAEELVQVFGLDITFTGTWRYKEVLPEWFGGGDEAVENRFAFRKAIELIDLNNGGVVRLSGTQYDFSSEKTGTAWGVDSEPNTGKEGIIEVHDNTHFVSDVGSKLKIIDDGTDIFNIYPVRSFVGSPTFTIELNDDDRIANPREAVPSALEGFEDKVYINDQFVGNVVAVTDTQLTLDSFNGVVFNVGDMVTIRRYAQYRLVKFDGSKNSSFNGIYLQGNREIFFHFGSQNAGEPSGFYYYGECNEVTVNNCEISDFPADAFLASWEGNFEGNTDEIYESGTINATTGAFEADANRIRSVNKYDLNRAKILQYDGFLIQDQGSYQQWNGVPKGVVNLYYYDVNDVFIGARLMQNMYEWQPLLKDGLGNPANYLRIVIDSTDPARFDYVATGGENSVELDRFRASISGTASTMKTFVYVNDVLLVENTDYTLSDGVSTTTVNFTSPLNASDVLLVSFQYYRILPVAALVPKNIIVSNNKIHDCGRQGLSITGMQNALIDNNICYNIYGQPGAFIDIEDGELYNRYITISNNTVYNCRLGVQLYATVNINIINNKFLRATDEEGGSNTTLKQLVGQSHVGGAVTVKNNYFEHGVCFVAPEMIFESNTLLFSQVQIKGGRCINNKFNNSSLKLYTEVSDYIGEMYISGNEFTTDNVYPNIYSAGLSMDVLSDEQTPSYFVNNTFKGNSGLNPAHFKKGLIVDDVTFYDTASVLINSATVNNLKGNMLADIIYVPADNEYVTYRGWELISDEANIRLRGATSSLHHFIFDKLVLESEKTTPYLIRPITSLGSLTIKNSTITDRFTTGTGWNLIDITGGGTVIDKLRMINCQVETATAGNLLNSVTDNTSWLYKDNIFTTVVLNNVNGVELNNIEE